MSISTRLKKIEQKISNRKREIIVVHEYNGEYYIEKGGKKIVIKDLDKSFPDKLIIILKQYD